GLLLVVVVDFLEIGVDDIIASLGAAIGLTFSAGIRLSGLVHGLTKLHRSFGKRVRLGLDVLSVIAFGGGAQGSNGILDRLAVVRRHLVTVVLEGLFGAVDQRLCLVAGFHRLAAL